MTHFGPFASSFASSSFDRCEIGWKTLEKMGLLLDLLDTFFYREPIDLAHFLLVFTRCRRPR